MEPSHVLVQAMYGSQEPLPSQERTPRVDSCRFPIRFCCLPPADKYGESCPAGRPTQAVLLEWVLLAGRVSSRAALYAARNNPSRPKLEQTSLLLRWYEILHHRPPHQIRRQQTLRQDEVMKLLLVELHSLR